MQQVVPPARFVCALSSRSSTGRVEAWLVVYNVNADLPVCQELVLSEALPVRTKPSRDALQDSRGAGGSERGRREGTHIWKPLSTTPISGAHPVSGAHALQSPLLVQGPVGWAPLDASRAAGDETPRGEGTAGREQSRQRRYGNSGPCGGPTRTLRSEAGRPGSRAVTSEAEVRMSGLAAAWISGPSTEP